MMDATTSLGTGQLTLSSARSVEIRVLTYLGYATVTAALRTPACFRRSSVGRTRERRRSAPDSTGRLQWPARAHRGPGAGPGLGLDGPYGPIPPCWPGAPPVSTLTIVNPAARAHSATSSDRRCGGPRRTPGPEEPIVVGECLGRQPADAVQPGKAGGRAPCRPGRRLGHPGQPVASAGGLAEQQHRSTGPENPVPVRRGGGRVRQVMEDGVAGHQIELLATVREPLRATGPGLHPAPHLFRVPPEHRQHPLGMSVAWASPTSPARHRFRSRNPVPAPTSRTRSYRRPLSIRPARFRDVADGGPVEGDGPLTVVRPAATSWYRRTGRFRVEGRAGHGD
jgi:hypothetical protein